MSRDAKSLLTDVEECVRAIKESTAGLEFDVYLANRENRIPLSADSLLLARR